MSCTPSDTEQMPLSHPATDACILPALAAWQAERVAAALVTLVGIEGRAPRPVGAQMAVAADGRTTGYISGGCLEAAVADEARRVILSGHNETIRFGRGSRFFDLKLPCGSGLDLYFDQALTGRVLGDALAHLRHRKPFHLATDLATGESHISGLDADGALPSSRLDGNRFVRNYGPEPRLLLIGAGPVLPAVATLARVAGLDPRVVSPDEVSRATLAQQGIAAEPLVSPEAVRVDWIDTATAALLVFHDHDWEAPLLQRILTRPGFYTGALGSHTAHAARCEHLAALGVPAEAIARVRGPVGLIAGAKSRQTLAAGIVAEILLAARERGLVD